MNSQNKEIIYTAFFMIIMPIIISTILSDKITATDWIYRHSVWINQYLRGDFSPIFVYPPLFHWMMLPFVAFNFPIKYFQIIFIILSTFGIFYYTYKKESEEILKNAAILLMTGIPYILFSGALMPQALDYFFFPLILLAYFKNNHKIVVISLFLMIFFHITAFIFAGILFLHSLLTKRYKFTKSIFALLLILAPFAFYYNYSAYAIDFQNKYDYKAQIQWESQFISPIWKFFMLSGILTWIYLPFAIYKLYKKKFKINDTQLLYLLWISAFTLLMFFQF